MLAGVAALLLGTLAAVPGCIGDAAHRASSPGCCSLAVRSLLEPVPFQELIKIWPDKSAIVMKS